jgi:hypothetical protein
MKIFLIIGIICFIFIVMSAVSYWLVSDLFFVKNRAGDYVISSRRESEIENTMLTEHEKRQAALDELQKSFDKQLDLTIKTWGKK